MKTKYLKFKSVFAVCAMALTGHKAYSLQTGKQKQDRYFLIYFSYIYGFNDY